MFCTGSAVQSEANIALTRHSTFLKSTKLAVIKTGFPQIK